MKRAEDQKMRRPFRHSRLLLVLLYLATLVMSLLLLLSLLEQMLPLSSWPDGSGPWPWARSPNARRRGPSAAMSKYQIKDNRGRQVFISEVLLPRGSAPLWERAVLRREDHSRQLEQSLLLMWDLPEFSDQNLRGCPDWNCTVSHDQSRADRASAVFFGSSHVDLRPRQDQYFVFYSQESPVNAFASLGFEPNMSFGFRMDTPGASPYGFAARLALESRPREPTKMMDQLMEGTVRNKSKAVAWFVSHCSTQSRREWIAQQMQKHIPVDIYGACGPLNCPKGNDCRGMLDRDYFFYFTAENSICKDYLTEKIWDQGLDTDSVPIVLRRNLVQHLLPPNSFIAVDDYPSVGQLAARLRWLMENPGEYLRYFEWRTEFVAVKMNGDTDPRAERLFGVCQVCRLTQMRPKPVVLLPAPVHKWWSESCENEGQLVMDLRKNEKNKRKNTENLIRIKT